MQTILTYLDRFTHRQQQQLKLVLDISILLFVVVVVVVVVVVDDCLYPSHRAS
jgi:hypothetical protein